MTYFLLWFVQQTLVSYGQQNQHPLLSAAGKVHHYPQKYWAIQKTNV